MLNIYSVNVQLPNAPADLRHNHNFVIINIFVREPQFEKNLGRNLRI